MLNGDARWNKFKFADSRASAVALYDRADRYFGFVHPETELDHLGEHDRDSLRSLKEFPDHKAVPMIEVPEYFWRCIVYAEDRDRGRWFNPYGVNMKGMMAAVRGRGGSTLEMQLARSMWKMHSGNSNKYLRKPQEWLSAPVLNRNLVKDKDDYLMSLWFSQHIPLIRGTGGESGSIYGVYGASQYLFGKTPEDLDVGEQLLLASAVKRPIRWKKTRKENAEMLYSYIGQPEDMRRGTLCASEKAKMNNGEFVIPNSALRKEANVRLSQLLNPDNLVPVYPGFERAHKAKAAQIKLTTLGPLTSGQALAPNVQRESIAELTDIIMTSNGDVDPEIATEGNERQHPWRGIVRELSLTIDVEKNWNFRQKARKAVLDFSEAYADDPNFRKTALPRRILGSDGNEDIILPKGHTPLLIAAANENGEIVRYYSTYSDTVYSGRGGQRRDIPGFGNANYDPERETRGIGSVSKMAAAMLIANKGANSSAQTVSNACMKGLEYRCHASWQAHYPKRVSLKRAWSESLNPPIVRTLGGNDVKKEEIDSFMEALNFRLPDAHSEANGVPRNTALTLGRYTGRPKSVHWLAATSLAVVRGKPSVVKEPHLIKMYTTLEKDENGQRFNQFVEPEVPIFTVKDYVDTKYPGFVKALLTAPLCDTRRGSLRRLKNWCAASNKDVKLHVAKTGTVSAQNTSGSRFDESDWWVAGGLEFSDGRAYSYVVTMGSGSPREAFANNMGGGRLAPIISVLLQDLKENG